MNNIFNEKEPELYIKENDLCNRWHESYSHELQELFCFDGLLYYRNPECNDVFSEVEKWENAKRKILFLMKDTNGNPGDDYRWWEEFYFIRGNFFQNIFKCLWALNKVTANYKPSFDESKPMEEYTAEAMQYPIAIVNVKKISGGANVKNGIIWDYYWQDKNFIDEQIRNILKPNIIVCGGGSGTLKNIALKIYSDMEFKKYNDWCYYCKQNDTLIIDDYHPSYPARDNEGMIAAVHEFYKQKEKKDCSII